MINSGTCFRAPEQVLEHWRERPRGRVGRATSIPTSPRPRSSCGSRQLDPERMGRNGQLAMEGAEAIGASGGPISRNAGNCVQCSSCPYGCRIDAKRGMHVSYLPRAVAAGARLRAGVEARRVLVEDGRAAGVRCGSPRPRTDAAAPTRSAPAGRRSSPAAPSARRSCCCAPASAATRSAATSTSTPPAGSAPATRRRCAAGTGVMQSYYVDEWESRAGPARGDLHAAALRRRLAARDRARATRNRCSTSTTSARSASSSTDHSSGPGRASPGDGSLRATYRLSDEDARRRRLRDRPRRRDPLRRRRERRSTPTSPGFRCCGPAIWPTFEATTLQALGAAAGGVSPDGHGADRRRTPARASAPPTARSTASPASTSPTPRSSRPRSASTR